jgi:teichuronic acid biosynthesis glycosyltransferase TuaG
VENNIISNPLVSVVVPVFNTEKYLPATIASIENQTYSNWELILVDDCSQDNSASICKAAEVKDQRVRFISQEVNQGALSARNTGIKNAKGDYICFLDSDDTFEVEKIDTQVRFMMEHQYDISFTMFQRITEEGKFMGKSNVTFSPKITYSQLLGNPQFSIITLMVNRNKVQIPVLELDLVRAEDYVFHLNLLKQGFDAFGINQALSNYRFRPGSQSTSFFGNAADLWKVLFQIEKLGALSSSFYFSRYLIKGFKKRITLFSQLSTLKKTTLK